MDFCVDWQEAEHRRIQEQQQRQATSKQQPKHLPDAIIMSLTQRVHQRQRFVPFLLNNFTYKNPPSSFLIICLKYLFVCLSSQLPQRSPPQRSPPQRAPIVSQPLAPSADDKVLSVSGKKKCSHCSLELGKFFHWHPYNSTLTITQALKHFFNQELK